MKESKCVGSYPVLLLLALLLAACGGGGGSTVVPGDVTVDSQIAPDSVSVEDVGAFDTGDGPLDTWATDTLSDAGTTDTSVDGMADAATDTGADDVQEDVSPDVQPCEPPDPDPALGPGGYPMDGWRWERLGVVLAAADEDVAPGDGYLSPALVAHEGRLELYFSRKEGLVHRLLRSTLEPGAETWSDPVALTGFEGDDFAANPSVLVENGRYRMWYGAGGISHAESDDGLNWTVSPEAALANGGPGAFDALSSLYPCVRRDGDRYVLWYVGFDGQRYAIGRAESADGLLFERSPADTPVLETGGSDEFDNASVAQPATLWSGDRWLLWYGGYDTSRTNPGPFRIGLAESVDGRSWDRLGVTLDLSADGPDAWSTRDATVARWQGGLYMVYVGMGTDSRYRLMAAHSETCH